MQQLVGALYLTSDFNNDLIHDNIMLKCKHSAVAHVRNYLAGFFFSLRKKNECN